MIINRDNDKGKVLAKRTIFIMLLNIVIMITMIFRLYYLQIYQADKYSFLADKNRISNRILTPRRGKIFDRNNVALAINQQNFMAMIVSEQTPDIDKTLESFGKITPLDEGAIKRIKKELRQNRSFIPIRVKDNLSWEEVAKIQLNSETIPGIFVDEGLNRFYPLGADTSHLLSYVSYATTQDLKNDDDPLLSIPEFRIGVDGIERLYEKNLRGKAGTLKQEVNAFGRIMQEIQRIEGTAGEDISLSIDARLQQKATEYFEDKSGAVTLLNIDTGEILVFASFPNFDPNILVKGIAGKDWRDLQRNEKAPLINKNIVGRYPPGSTFKMMTALSALENKIVTKDTSTFCTGDMMLGNHTFHCWKKHGHGNVDIVEAIKHSCDIFFYEVSLKLGINNISDTARMFGLGEKTNIGFNGEKSGIIPNRQWKLDNFKEGWQQGESLISGIGQGYVLVTPIQLAIMTAQIANGGYKISPTFIKSPTGIKDVSKKIDVKDSNLEIIKKGMFKSVNEVGGNAFLHRFDYKGKKMGGKTGTAQVRRITMKERNSGIIKQPDLPWKFRDHGLFIGYAPHDNPKYAVAVVVEHGGGASSAVPIASKLLLEALKLEDEK